MKTYRILVTELPSVHRDVLMLAAFLCGWMLSTSCVSEPEVVVVLHVPSWELDIEGLQMVCVSSLISKIILKQSSQRNVSWQILLYCLGLNGQWSHLTRTVHRARLWLWDEEGGWPWRCGRQGSGSGSGSVCSPFLKESFMNAFSCVLDNIYFFQHQFFTFNFIALTSKSISTSHPPSSESYTPSHINAQLDYSNRWQSA